MRRNSLLTVLFMCLAWSLSAQQALDIKRVEPAFWWAGMKNTTLQIMLYGQDLAGAKVSIDNDRVTLLRAESLDNPNYLFLYLEIGQAEVGKFTIQLSKGKLSRSIPYELKAREARNIAKESINPSDLIYLITPDRFANGDPKNDQVAGMIEQTNRSDVKARHGGDLRGIINNLDYIADLGMTAIWLNPPQENDQPYPSYHGYGVTDFYLTDRRFGTNEEYRELADKAHQKGMKMVMDQIFNHCGIGHWWMKDKPSSDWINDKEKYGRSLFHNPTAADPYASKHDLDRHQKGWFDDTLPDLNTENPHLQTYLIQNTIWWIEYLRLDGIRIDTYPYPNGHFMTKLARLLQDEFPGLFVTGEVWVGSVSIEAFWNNAAINKDGRHGHLHSITDFPLYFNTVSAFKPDGNLMNIADVLAEDVVYGSPELNVIFLDNHDVNRFYADIEEDAALWKVATAYLMTTRGIPQWYYGSEILMKGQKPDWVIREDMPGGWNGDDKNAFTGKNLSEAEKEAMTYVQKLGNWRKTAIAVHEGELLHFVPEENIYVYFRIHTDQTVMVILNKNTEQKTLQLDRFYEALQGFSTGTDVISGKQLNITQAIPLDGKSAYILTLE